MVSYNNEERSSLWGISATTATLGGAAYGIYKSKNSISDLKKTIITPNAVKSSIDNFSSLSKFNTNQHISSNQSASAVIDLISQNTTYKTEIIRDIAQASYEATLKTGQHSAKDAYGIFRSVGSTEEISDAFQKASSLFKEQSVDPSLFNKRIEQFFPGGIYNTSRIESNKSVTLNIPTYRERESISWKDLSTEGKNNINDIERRLTAAAKSSGGSFKIGKIYQVEDMLNNQKITTEMLVSKIGKREIAIPLNDTGLTYTGTNLQTKYTTRQTFNLEGKNTSFRTEYVDALEEAIAKSKNQQQLRANIHDVNRNILQSFMNGKTSDKSLAIWQMPKEVETAGSRARSRISQRERIYKGDDPFEKGIRDKVISETHNGNLNLYPIGSPDAVSKGTFISGNITEDIYGPSARLSSIEQRSTQFIKADFQPTQQYRDSMPTFSGTFGENFQRSELKVQGKDYRYLIGDYQSPQLVTTYLKPKAYEEGLSKILHNEEIAFSQKIVDSMEYERTIQKKISMNYGFAKNKTITEVLDNITAGKTVPLNDVESNFIGVEHNTGKEILKGRNRVVGVQRLNEESAMVYMREKTKLSDKDTLLKFFGEDAKVASSSDSSIFKNATNELGVKYAGGQEIEAITNAKQLQKNKMAQMHQQIEALGMHLGNKLDTQQVYANQDLLDFMNRPAKYLKMNSLNSQNLEASEYAIKKSMISLAKSYNFSQYELGTTFGLMSDNHLSQMVNEGLLSTEESKAISNSSYVFGLSKGQLGDTSKLGGTGKKGTLEHSGFRNLVAKGADEERIAAELSTRMIGKGELEGSNKMLASLLNEQDYLKPFLKNTPKEERILSEIPISELIQDEGRYISFGDKKVNALGGSSGIYIPGRKETHDMLGANIAQGKRIENPIVSDLLNFQKALKNNSEEEIENTATKLRNNVFQYTERQSSTSSSRIAGSNYLFATRQTEAQSSKLGNAIAIHPDEASKMYDDLIHRSKDIEQVEFLKEQKSKILSGESVPGMSWRHPMTGKESFQFSNLRTDSSVPRNVVSVPFQMGKLSLEGKESIVDTSIAVGQKLDFDADRISVGIIGNRQSSESIQSKIGGELTNNYNDYLFNHYAAKSLTEASRSNIKAPNDVVERIISETDSLVAAKTQTPKVNLALQEAKLAVQTVKSEKYNTLSNLFWHLEESAIGGKHGARSSEVYEQITHSLQQRSTSGFQDVIESLMGKEARTIFGSLNGQQHSFNYNPQEWAEDTISSLKTVDADVKVAIQSGRLTKNQIPEYISDNVSSLQTMFQKRTMGSIDPAQELMRSQVYKNTINQSINSGLRNAETKMSSFLNKFKKAKGPAAIGAAIGAGIMMASPAISGEVARPKEGPAGGRNLVSDNLNEAMGGIETPPARIMTSPKVYDINKIKNTPRANIRVSMDDANRSSPSFMKMSSNLSGNVRIQTRDDREAISPYRLANKIQERL